jgi:hypothetical protein
MSSVFFAPVDESYRRLLESPIDLTDWDDRPDDFPEEARVWGVRTDPEQGEWSRNRSNWQKMELGDRVFFYRDGEFFATGRVSAMCETDFVRDRYWPGGPATSIYAVEDYRNSLGLSIDTVNTVLGYKENYCPQGLRRVADHRPTDRLLRRIGLE